MIQIHMALFFAMILILFAIILLLYDTVELTLTLTMSIIQISLELCSCMEVNQSRAIKPLISVSYNMSIVAIIP